MDMRFKLAAAGFIAVMALLTTVDPDMMQGLGAIYVALGVLLVFAVVALFPNVNRGDTVDRSAAGGSWSDHIEFEEPKSTDSSDGGWR